MELDEAGLDDPGALWSGGDNVSQWPVGCSIVPVEGITPGRKGPDNVTLL